MSTFPGHDVHLKITPVFYETEESVGLYYDLTNIVQYNVK